MDNSNVGIVESTSKMSGRREEFDVLNASVSSHHPIAQVRSTTYQRNDGNEYVRQNDGIINVKGVGQKLSQKLG